ncbi:MAG: hypothetical protein ACREFL_10880 [Stellaceae bacterium]
MASKFRRGATVYAANGRSYVVAEVDEGVVYCSTAGGAETEFAEANLLTEAEWTARSDNKAGLIYARLRQARAYAAPPPKLDRLGAEQVLAKIERLMPGMLDYAAFTIAARILADSGDAALAGGLSIVKCREVFEAARPELRASLVASLLATPPEALIGAGRLGDNLMRAMLDKGMAGQEADFEAFGDRRRV